MLDDVAAYLVLAPIAVVVATAAGFAGWRLRRRAEPVQLRTAGARGSRRISD